MGSDTQSGRVDVFRTPGEGAAQKQGNDVPGEIHVNMEDGAVHVVNIGRSGELTVPSIQCASATADACVVSRVLFDIRQTQVDDSFSLV